MVITVAALRASVSGSFHSSARWRLRCSGNREGLNGSRSNPPQQCCADRHTWAHTPILNPLAKRSQVHGASYIPEVDGTVSRDPRGVAGGRVAGGTFDAGRCQADRYRLAGFVKSDDYLQMFDPIVWIGHDECVPDRIHSGCYAPNAEAMYAAWFASSSTAAISAAVRAVVRRRIDFGSIRVELPCGSRHSGNV